MNQTTNEFMEKLNKEQKEEFQRVLQKEREEWQKKIPETVADELQRLLDDTQSNIQKTGNYVLKKLGILPPNAPIQKR